MQTYILRARRELSRCRVQRSRCCEMQKMTSRCRWARLPTMLCMLHCCRSVLIPLHLLVPPGGGKRRLPCALSRGRGPLFPRTDSAPSGHRPSPASPDLRRPLPSSGRGRVQTAQRRPGVGPQAHCLGFPGPAPIPGRCQTPRDSRYHREMPPLGLLSGRPGVCFHFSVLS